MGIQVATNGINRNVNTVKMSVSGVLLGCAAVYVGINGVGRLCFGTPQPIQPILEVSFYSSNSGYLEVTTPTERRSVQDSYFFPVQLGDRVELSAYRKIVYIGGSGYKLISQGWGDAIIEITEVNSIVSVEI